MTDTKRYIMHVDGDAFFASCEVSRRPDLWGKPVVVGEDRGIACAMTKEAKALGITRGMPIYQIRESFAHVVVLSSHFDLYQEYHDNLVALLSERLPVVESYSIDECFAELPEMPDAQIESFMQTMKSDIKRSLGITFSFGVAPTKTLAKLASKIKKPDGCVILIDKKKIDAVARHTAIGSVWGIGYKTNERLARRGIRTVADFLRIPLAQVHEKFAEPIAEIWQELSGMRMRDVHAEHDDHKSIQATRSLIKATDDPAILFSELSRNIEIACTELRSMGLYTNAVHFFYAHKVGQSRYKFRRSARVVLRYHTDDTRTILAAVTKIVAEVYKTGYRYKSTGVTLSGLARKESIQNDLFGAQQERCQNPSGDRTVDALNRKFGDWSIMYASSMHSVRERQIDQARRAAKDSYEYGLPLPYMGEVY